MSDLLFRFLEKGITPPVKEVKLQNPKQEEYDFECHHVLNKTSEHTLKFLVLLRIFVWLVLWVVLILLFQLDHLKNIS